MKQSLKGLRNHQNNMTDSFYITLSALGIPALAAIIYCIKGEIDIRKERKQN